MCGYDQLFSFLPLNETWHHSAPQSTEGSQDPQTPSFWRTKAAPTHQPLSLERQSWAQRGEGDCAHPRWSGLFHYQSYTVLVGLLACLLFQGFEWRKLDCSDCPILECDIPFVYFFIMDLKEYLFDCRVLIAAHRLFLASRGTLHSGAHTLVVAHELSCPPGMWDPSSPIRDWAHVVSIARQILHHCTIKKVLVILFRCDELVGKGHNIGWFWLRFYLLIRASSQQFMSFQESPEVFIEIAGMRKPGPSNRRWGCSQPSSRLHWSLGSLSWWPTCSSRVSIPWFRESC